jgi:Sigma-70, region 4
MARATIDVLHLARFLTKRTTLSLPMSPLRSLAPDQRAVLELLLRQGRTYEELSEMLGLAEAGVRDRAHAALAALAPERVAPVGEDGAVADWILGQQDDEEAGRTAESVARMPAWHAWASEVTDRLSEVEGAEIPELPEPEADAPAERPPATKKGPAAKRPRPVRDNAAGAQKARARADATASKGRPRPVRERAAKPATAAKPAPVAAEPAAATSGGGGLALRSSRLGGALVIGALVLIVGAFLVWFLTRGDDSGKENASSGAKATATATATPRVVNEITLKGVGNKSQGLMRVFQREQDGKLVFALAADNVPKNKAQEVYAVWFTKKGSRPRNLGFAQTQVGANNVFTTGGPQQGQETDFAKWLADYDKVIVARASADAASSKAPGQVVLQGTLPGGQS